MKKPSVYLIGVTEGMKEADTATIWKNPHFYQGVASCKHAIRASIDYLAREGHLEAADCLRLKAIEMWGGQP